METMAMNPLARVAGAGLFIGRNAEDARKGEDSRVSHARVLVTSPMK